MYMYGYRDQVEIILNLALFINSPCHSAAMCVCALMPSRENVVSHI